MMISCHSNVLPLCTCWLHSVASRALVNMFFFGGTCPGNIVYISMSTYVDLYLHVIIHVNPGLINHGL